MASPVHPDELACDCDDVRVIIRECGDAFRPLDGWTLRDARSRDKHAQITRPSQQKLLLRE